MRWRRVFQAKEAGLVGVILAMAVLLTAFGGQVRKRDPDTGRRYHVNKFLHLDNLDKVVKNTSFFAIMAVGATMIIMSGGIDLSVGSIYCLSAVTAAMFLHHFGPAGPGGGASPHWVVPAGMLVCVAVGAVCGLINGIGVVLLGVHPFVITLGTMAIYRGIAFVMTRGQSYTDFPAEFTDGLIRLEAGSLNPVPMAIMLLVVVGGAIFLRHTVTGRYVYAVGGNELAARFSGVRVGWIKIIVFTIGGLTGGVAAMIMLGYYGSASSGEGQGYELDVIAAAVVGGASLTGGRGSAVGALLGALVIKLIENGIIILEIEQNYSRIIIGAVIVLAVVLDQVSNSLRTRRLVRAGTAKST